MVHLEHLVIQTEASIKCNSTVLTNKTMTRPKIISIRTIKRLRPQVQLGQVFLARIKGGTEEVIGNRISNRVAARMAVKTLLLEDRTDRTTTDKEDRQLTMLPVVEEEVLK